MIPGKPGGSAAFHPPESSDANRLEEASGPIRVAIVDDHLVLVDALHMIIESQPDMTVVESGGCCAECLDLVQRTLPQVLLLDVILPDGDGISLAPKIKAIHPDTNILILTSLADQATLLRAMQAGVSGFVSKSRNLLEVLQAIRQAAAGEIAIPTSLLVGLLSQAPRANPRNGNSRNESPDYSGSKGNIRSAASQNQVTLTARELEILNLLARGSSIDEIACQLSIAPLTARTHIRNLLQKLGAHSRLQAVTYALSCGLIQPPV